MAYTYPAPGGHSMKRMDRTKVKLTGLSAHRGDEYVEGTPAERLALVWDLTVLAWGLATGGKIHAQSRLQRDVAVLRRGKG